MSIKAQNLVKSFSTTQPPVLKDINLQIKDGEFVSLVGRSGSGKSTLLYALSSLDRPSSGHVFLDDVDLTTASEKEIHRIRNEKIGFVFQFHHLLPELSALENVLMPAHKSGQADQRNDKAHYWLSEFGLADKLNRRPSQLSGGEQQRVAIARALIMDPKYIFADEPTGNLDSVNGERIIETLENINCTRSATIVMVTHDNAFAARAQRQIHLVDGRITDRS